MKIPLFPLDLVLFPGAALPLHIFEDRYREMMGICIEHEEPFGVVRAHSEGLAVIGCTARVVRVLRRYHDGRMDVLCEGMDRFEIELLDDTRSYLQAEVNDFEDNGKQSTRKQREECAALHFEMMEFDNADTPQHLAIDLDRPVVFLLAAALPVDLNFKQELLSSRSDAERTARLLGFYNAVLPKLRDGGRTSRPALRNGLVM